MITNLVKVGFSLLLLVCIINNNSYAANTGTVSITTISESEQISDRKVVLISWINESFKSTAITDVDGKVSFQGVPVGDFDVYVTDDNGETLAKNKGNVTHVEVLELSLQL